jgi:hypothetical protein
LDKQLYDDETTKLVDVDKFRISYKRFPHSHKYRMPAGGKLLAKMPARGHPQVGISMQAALTARLGSL